MESDPVKCPHFWLIGNHSANLIVSHCVSIPSQKNHGCSIKARHTASAILASNFHFFKSLFLIHALRRCSCPPQLPTSSPLFSSSAPLPSASFNRSTTHRQNERIANLFHLLSSNQVARHESMEVVILCIDPGGCVSPQSVGLHRPNSCVSYGHGDEDLATVYSAENLRHLRWLKAEWDWKKRL